MVEYKMDKQNLMVKPLRMMSSWKNCNCQEVEQVDGIDQLWAIGGRSRLGGKMKGSFFCRSLESEVPQRSRELPEQPN
jgi:hypothetical protein